ncbi:MAG: hypothetical protein AAEJ04_06455 [Planctomycetota bacterium]
MILFYGAVLPAQSSTDPSTQVSRTQIGGVKFSLKLPDAPRVVPALPDLSRNGVYEIPGGLLLEAPLPVLWAGTLVPPGKHSLSIEVSVGSVVHLLVQPFGGGPAVRVPLVRGILDRPAERIHATLSSVELDQESRLLLHLQWGPLILSCVGEKISLQRQELGDWVLDTYSFSDQFFLPAHCVIGSLENRVGDEPLQRLVFISGKSDAPQLRLEDPARERIAAARAELLGSLRRSQSRLRRIEGGADSEAGELETLQKRIARAFQQRSALDAKLMQLDEGEGVKILFPTGAKGVGSAGLQVRLASVEERTMLQVISSLGRYQFMLGSRR